MEKTFWYWFGCSTAMANSAALMLFSLLYGSGPEMVVGTVLGAVGLLMATWLLMRPTRTRWLQPRPRATSESRPSSPLSSSSVRFLHFVGR